MERGDDDKIPSNLCDDGIRMTCSRVPLTRRTWRGTLTPTLTLSLTLDYVVDQDDMFPSSVDKKDGGAGHRIGFIEGDIVRVRVASACPCFSCARTLARALSHLFDSALPSQMEYSSSGGHGEGRGGGQQRPHKVVIDGVEHELIFTDWANMTAKIQLNEVNMMEAILGTVSCRAEFNI